MAGGCLWDLGGYIVNMARRVAHSEPTEVEALAVMGASGGTSGSWPSCASRVMSWRSSTAPSGCPTGSASRVLGCRATLTLAPAFLMAPDGPSAGIRIRRDGVEEHLPIEDHDQYQAEVDDLH